MNKKEKKAYIDRVHLRFEDARNHGRNGNNWWYPTPFVMAYNVKMYGREKTLDDFREKMTKRQNEYYTDDMLENEWWYLRNNECEALAEYVKENDGVLDVWYAGRSGGWIEVQYTNSLCLSDDCLESDFREAKALEALEAKIEKEIAEYLKRYKKYLNSEEWRSDFVDGLLDDEAIAEIYKERAEEYIEKLR